MYYLFLPYNYHIKENVSNMKHLTKRILIREKESSFALLLAFFFPNRFLGTKSIKHLTNELQFEKIKCTLPADLFGVIGHST